MHHNVLILYTYHLTLSAKMFKSNNYLHYKCTRPLLSTTYSQPCHIVHSSILFFHFTLTNWEYKFPKYCHQNYWSFINSKHLLGIITLLTHIFVCTLFGNSQELLLFFSPVCTFIIFGCKLMAIFLLRTCLILLWYY